MRVLIVGTSGMVGQGVLRECLRDDGVEQVLSLGRAALEQRHTKLRHLVHADLLDLRPIERELSGLDACFFCLGASAAGSSEEQYTRVNHDITLSVARTLARVDPDTTFVYVSGMGTDCSERGRVMWARVKGRTENELLRLPFRAAYMLRPAAIVPMHGIASRTRLYRIPYLVLGPVLPFLHRLAPRYVTTSERVGRAMLRLVRVGFPSRVLENRDIDRLGAAP